MERLRSWFYSAVQRTNTTFKRYLWNEIRWENRLIILLGARGVGKTTLLLQYIKLQLPINQQTLYVSLDDIYFSNHTLVDFAVEFVREGGKYLILDEAQKYQNWSREVKNIYDNFPDLKLIVSGSSTIELLRSEGDLSRRALYYKLNGLSFREYLNFELNQNAASYTLQEILSNGLQISLELTNQISIHPHFSNYLHAGFYPFYKEDKAMYHKRLQQVINTVMDVDLVDSFQIDVGATHKVKKLMAEIASLVPFKPNIKKLSEQLGISRDTLIKYLQLMDRADLLRLIYSRTKGISALNKPEKIFLNNPNLAYALSDDVNKGSLRETFFVSQLSTRHKVRYAEAGDFMIDDQWTFEVGGKGKTGKQIAGLENAKIAADDIDIVQGNKIPLWIFGFLY
ncbi:MAG: ATP-binding protein [Cyclobacteriaceae bacterium]|nr:ATP-binding protein [Cyclobacteriaceae bacterium]